MVEILFLEGSVYDNAFSNYVLEYFGFGANRWLLRSWRKPLNDVVLMDIKAFTCIYPFGSDLALHCYFPFHCMETPLMK